MLYDSSAHLQHPLLRLLVRRERLELVRGEHVRPWRRREITNGHA
jgi:hypothetical protein